MKVLLTLDVDDDGGYAVLEVQQVVERALDMEPSQNPSLESLDEVIGESIAGLGVVIGEISVTVLP